MCGDPLLRHCGERRDRFGWVSRQISGVGAQCPPHQWTTIPLPLHMFNSHPGWLLTVTCCYLSIFLSPHEKNIFQSKSTQSPSPTHQVSKNPPLTKVYKQVDYFFLLGKSRLFYQWLCWPVNSWCEYETPIWALPKFPRGIRWCQPVKIVKWTSFICFKGFLDDWFSLKRPQLGNHAISINRVFSRSFHLI